MKLVRSFGVSLVPPSVFCFWKIEDNDKRIDTVYGNQLNTESQSKEFKARQTTTCCDGCFLIYCLPFCTQFGVLEGRPL